EHAALDGALQGTRAVHGIVALFNNPIFCRLCQDEVNLPIRKPLQEGRELNVDDVPDLAASKRVEKDDVVHAVQELRFEVRAHRLEQLAADSLVDGRLAALGPFGDVVTADVGRHDDDAVLEIDRTALPVRQSAIVEKLQHDVQDF